MGHIVADYIRMKCRPRPMCLTQTGLRGSAHKFYLMLCLK